MAPGNSRREAETVSILRRTFRAHRQLDEARAQVAQRNVHLRMGDQEENEYGRVSGLPRQLFAVVVADAHEDPRGRETVRMHRVLSQLSHQVESAAAQVDALVTFGQTFQVQTLCEGVYPQDGLRCAHAVTQQLQAVRVQRVWTSVHTQV